MDANLAQRRYMVSIQDDHNSDYDITPPVMLNIQEADKVKIILNDIGVTFNLHEVLI